MPIKAAAATGQKRGGDGEPPQRQGDSMASWGRTSSHRSHDRSWRKTSIHSPCRAPFHTIGISCESLRGSEGATGGVSTWTWIRWIKVRAGTVRSVLPPWFFGRCPVLRVLLPSWLPAHPHHVLPFCRLLRSLGSSLVLEQQNPFPS